eukprot:scaffold612_cov98-Cylindrotheca_fusiformis.AAC.2
MSLRQVTFKLSYPVGFVDRDPFESLKMMSYDIAMPQDIAVTNLPLECTVLWLVVETSEAFSAVQQDYCGSSSSTRSKNVVWLQVASPLQDPIADTVVDTTTTTTSNNVATSKVMVDWDWEQLAKDVFENDSRPIVLFDGVCNLCNGGVNFAIDRDADAKLRFASLQSKVAKSLLLNNGLPLLEDTKHEDATIVLVTKRDGAYCSSDAVSRICKLLDAQPLQWLGHLGQWTPQWIREPIYKYVSNNRYHFGENDQCRIDFDGTYTSRFVSDPDL